MSALNSNAAQPLALSLRRVHLRAYPPRFGQRLSKPAAFGPLSVAVIAPSFHEASTLRPDAEATGWRGRSCDADHRSRCRTGARPDFSPHIHRSNAGTVT